jgi:membrane associated rhomboid family serine protease
MMLMASRIARRKAAARVGKVSIVTGPAASLGAGTDTVGPHGTLNLMHTFRRPAHASDWLLSRAKTLSVGASSAAFAVLGLVTSSAASLPLLALAGRSRSWWARSAGAKCGAQVLGLDDHDSPRPWWGFVRRRVRLD